MPVTKKVWTLANGLIKDLNIAEGGLRDACEAFQEAFDEMDVGWQESREGILVSQWLTALSEGVDMLQNVRRAPY